MRLFDAGMGDGTVLTRVMREMHRRLPTLPFYVVGKEISLEDVRLSLDKMADRFHEHPATVLVVTNMYYTEAPWLTPKALSAATSLVWHEVALTGATAAEFSEQIKALEPFLAKVWQARHSPKTGNPVYERPVALVIYRDDSASCSTTSSPQQGRARADYDLVIASQPYRARVPVEFKAAKVIAPLTRALRPGGRLLGIHSCGAIRGWRSSARSGPTRTPSRPTATTSCAPCGPSSARTRATTISTPTPTSAPYFATTCTRCPPRSPIHRHLHAVCRLERRRLRGADRRRAARRGARPRAATSMPRARCCRRTASCGFSTNPT